MEKILERCTKAELIALIHQMVERYADLELLILRSAVGDAKERPVVDPMMVRRQVNNIFYAAEDNQQSAFDVAWKLGDVVKVGDDCAEQEDWPNAATVYENVAQGVLNNYEIIYDHDGDLSWKVNECASGLGRCLAGTQDPIRRETFLRALFDIYRWDVDYGGVGIGKDVPAIILEQATPEERQRVAGWVHDVMPTGDDRRTTWRREHFGGFLVELEKNLLDDEAFLQLCRQTGRTPELVDRLLALGKIDEAAAYVRQVDDHTLLTLAELFVSHSYGDQVWELIRERARTSQDRRLIEWLKEWARARGDLEEALMLVEMLFWQLPSMPGYQELKSLARTLARWEGVEGLRATVLARLFAASKHALLTQIHLEEDEIDRALEMLAHVRSASRGWGQPLHIRVARAAEQKRPRAAIDLYVGQIEQLIKARGRDNYAEAVKYLCRVRDLYQGLGELETWVTLITNLRARNRHLPALKDELNKAGQELGLEP
jgi:hypothetical protein